jgi:16S rRNA (guanine527-N7)-methyltransferase
MDAARISALLEPFLGSPNGLTDDKRLTTGDLDKISTYIDLLLRWNARINLTAIRDPEQIVPRHFGESFFLARHLFPAHEQLEAAPPFASSAKGGNTTTESTPETRVPQVPARSVRANLGAGAINSVAPTAPARVIDLGSGAGFPALPIKIWAPEIHLTLIESNHKKAAFLREVVRSLTLTNVDVMPERAETVAARLPQPGHSEKEESALPPHQESQPPFADVVTFRAVEKFDKILPLAASFLAAHGRLALLISSAQEPRLSTVPNLKWKTKPAPQSRERVLAIGWKYESGI